MKRIIFAALSIMLIVSSCKKSQDYGFNVDNSPKGVAFNQAVNLVAGTQARDTISLTSGVTPSATTQTLSDVYITLESEQVSNVDVTVGIVVKPSLVPQGYVALTSAQAQVPTSIKIPAGKQFVQIPVVFPNTSSFSLTTTYAIGLEITTADQGYQVAVNRKQIVIAYNVKNNYDGRYKLDFSNYHPTLNPLYTGNSIEVELRTTSSTSCNLFVSAPPYSGLYCIPAILNGNFSYFGTQEASYTFNPTTNAVTVQNVAAGAVTFYTMNPSYPNNYDPINKIINVKWGYSYVGGTFALGASREWTQKFTYLGPR